MKDVWCLWISSVLLAWSVVSGHPCNIDKLGRATCSGKSLLHPPISLPRHITNLDLSFNSLVIPTHGTFLRRFSSLRSLNLSSNIIPMIHSSFFNNLGALRHLDLSNCSISYVHPKSFQGLKSLHSLFLNNNKLRSLDASVFPVSGILVHLDLRYNELSSELLNMDRIYHVRLQGNPSVYRDCITPSQQVVHETEAEQVNDSHLELQTQEVRMSDYQDLGHRRKLQSFETNPTETPSPLENYTSTAIPSQGKGGKNWIYFAAFVLSAVTISLLIALIAKCKLLQRNRARYHHQRLSDSRSVGSSHVEEGDVDMSFGRNQSISEADGCHPEDDDGFIEDNYIVPNQDLKEEEEEMEPHFKLGGPF